MHASNGNIRIISGNFGKKAFRLNQDTLALFKDMPEIVMFQEVIAFNEQVTDICKKFLNIGYVGIGSAIKKSTIISAKNARAKKKKIPTYTFNDKHDRAKNHTSSFIFIRKEIYDSNMLINKYERDPTGRTCNITLRISEDESITIWSIYGPPSGVQDNNKFFNHLSLEVNEHDKTIQHKGYRNSNIFGGDFNAVMDQINDRKKESLVEGIINAFNLILQSDASPIQLLPDEPTLPYTGFLNFIQTHNLLDVFTLSSTKPDFTFIRNSKTQSRIDWFLISSGNNFRLTARTLPLNTNILKDHRPIEMDIHIPEAFDNLNSISEDFHRDRIDLENDEMQKLLDSTNYKFGNKELNELALKLEYDADVDVNMADLFLKTWREWTNKFLRNWIRDREMRYEKELNDKVPAPTKNKSSNSCLPNTDNKKTNPTIKFEEAVKKIRVHDYNTKAALNKDPIANKGKNEEAYKTKERQRDNDRKCLWSKMKLKREGSFQDKINSLINTNSKIERCRHRKNELRQTLRNDPTNIDIRTSISDLNNKIKALYEVLNNRRFIKKLRKIQDINNHDIKNLNDLLNRGILEKTVIRKAILDGQIITGKTEVLKYFVDGWSSILQSNTQDSINIEENEDIRDNDITIEEFDLMINNLSSNTSPGPNNLNGATIIHAKYFHTHLHKVFSIFYKHRFTPVEWKDSLTRLIFKQGDPENFSNYRPICLLNLEYKAFSWIINKKLQKYFYSNDAAIGTIPHKCHDLQFGFRPEFSTDQAIWTYKGILENAQANRKEIHVTYLDFSKAYDKVEWVHLIKAMKNYNIPNAITNNIIKMLQGRKTKFITPVGLSDNIEITRGVPQGDIISPILFNIFFNILLDEISRSGIGYKLGGQDIPTIPFIAYADDLTLITENREDMTKMIQIVSKFCDNTGFDINLEKTKYTTNSEREYSTPLSWRGSPLATINKNDAFKYLGLWISLDLAWDNLQKKLISNLAMNLNKLKSKRFNTMQRISLINSIAIPYIRYSMNFVKLPEEFVSTLDSMISTHLNCFLGVQYNLKKERYYGDHKDGLLGLLSLKDVQIQAFTSSILNRGINFNSQFPKQILKLNKDLIDTYLQWSNSPFPFTDSTHELELILNKLNLETIGWDDIIGTRTYKSRLDTNVATKVPNLESNELTKINFEYDDYILVGTDGSKTEEGTGCGYSFGGKPIYDHSSRASYADTNLSAELESIVLAITSVPSNTNILIASDSLVSINLINSLSFSNKQRNGLQEYPIVALIQHLIKSREGKTLIEYVPAHQGEKSRKHKIDDITKRNNEIDSKYGINTHLQFKRVNQVADYRAGLGTHMPLRTYDSIPKGYPEICVRPINRAFPRGGDIKGLIKSILADQNRSAFLNLTKLTDNPNAPKLSQILPPFQNELFSFVFKLRAGNLNFGYHKDRLTPLITDKSFHSFSSIRNPSSFCEFECCNFNHVLNDTHLFTQCQHPPIKLMRENMLTSIQNMLLQDEDITKRGLQTEANEFPSWFHMDENYAIFQYNQEIWEAYDTNELLPEEFITDSIIEEPAEFIYDPSLDKELQGNSNTVNAKSKDINERFNAVFNITENPTTTLNKKKKKSNNKLPLQVKDSYSPEELKKLTCPELKEILGTLKLKKNGKKIDLINRILNYYTIKDISKTVQEPITELSLKLGKTKPIKLKINDNPDNKVPRKHIAIRDDADKVNTIERIQTNLIVARTTTLKNINSRNKSLSKLVNGKITNHASKKFIPIKQTTRGIVNSILTDTIKKQLKLNNGDTTLVNKLATKINNLYLIGSHQIFEIFKKENTLLRKIEGVDINKRSPEVINKFDKRTKIFNPGIT